MAKTFTKQEKQEFVQLIPEIAKTFFNCIDEGSKRQAFVRMNEEHPCFSSSMIASTHQLMKHKIMKLKAPDRLKQDIGLHCYDFVSSELKKYLNNYNIVLTFSDVTTHEIMSTSLHLPRLEETTK